MDCEETMIANAENIKRANPKGVTWVYCNSVEALPWLTHVREKLEDPQYSGFFMAKAGCVPRSGHYICGPNATDNLYHDFEQVCTYGLMCESSWYIHMVAWVAHSHGGIDRTFTWWHGDDLGSDGSETHLLLDGSARLLRG
eukprot:TRINITY_DN12312_c0_g1_i1.p5 TRINITY_DN12312_c0_g1~~TRINITY_DN12312_c0_g1_i1.p5  ORF type:complete len:141 (+),score=4.70 TRINITY_DN12312_c0_g1_i1:2899-3321(+)